MAEHRAGRHNHHRDTRAALGIALAIRPEQNTVGRVHVPIRGWLSILFRRRHRLQCRFHRDVGAPWRAGLRCHSIGAYEPREFMRESHCNPEEAVRIFQDLGAGQAIGVHWGTFKLTLKPLAGPPQRLRAALQEAGIPLDRFRELTHGERWDLYSRPVGAIGRLSRQFITAESSGLACFWPLSELFKRWFS